MTIVLNAERLDSSPLTLGTRQGCLLLSFLFNTLLGVLAAIKQAEETKVIQIEKEKAKLSLLSDDMIVYVENCKDFF